MFVQVITARAADPEGLERQMQEWQQRLRPGATGFLGSTSGVTPDGNFVAIARFESTEAARANSDRPEQGEWWAATEACLDGPAQFRDSEDVTLYRGGGSNEAGFVQIMIGRCADRARYLELEDELERAAPEGRPDLIGGLNIWHPDGTLTLAAYFTSETEARAGEKEEPPAEVAEILQEWMGQFEDVKYYDLPHPWLN